MSLQARDAESDRLALDDFSYDLPAELIAQEPAGERDASRLLVLNRATAGLEHACFRDLPAYLRPGDLLVFNDTRVRPARLYARVDTGGRVEVLLLREAEELTWHCLGKPGRHFRPGVTLRFADAGAVVLRAQPEGGYLIRFDVGTDVPALLARHGEVPLPPYIHRSTGPLAVDAERYQTVYARSEGAVAAPTAGLHFTEPLLERLRESGIELAWLTLHVGPGTFLPVRACDVREHVMGAEWAEVPGPTADAIRRAREEKRRVVAVGTTTTRALESRARERGDLQPGSFWADVFIYPGFAFRVVDALITNFHLPRSTLLMLVSAFAGRELILEAYRTAVEKRYRFYSYGDAMLIV